MPSFFFSLSLTLLVFFIFFVGPKPFPNAPLALQPFGVPPEPNFLGI